MTRYSQVFSLNVTCPQKLGGQVPNVRIALARALAGDVVVSAANRDYVSKCVDMISKDKDSDVLYWARRAKQ